MITYLKGKPVHLETGLDGWLYQYVILERGDVVGIRIPPDGELTYEEIGDYRLYRCKLVRGHFYATGRRKPDNGNSSPDGNNAVS